MSFAMVYTYKSLAEGAANDLPFLRSLNIDVVLNYWYCYWNPVYASLGQANSVPPADAEVIAWLDVCYASGLKAILDIRPWTGWTTTGPRNPANIPVLQDYVSRFKDHPGLYGWHTDDEAAPLYYTISDRINVYNAIKAVDPVHPVMEVPQGGHSSDPSTVYSLLSHDIDSIYTYPLANGISYSGALAEMDSYLGLMRPLLPDPADHIFTVLQASKDDESYEDVPQGWLQDSAAHAASYNMTWGLAFYMWDAPLGRRSRFPARYYTRDKYWLILDMAQVAKGYSLNPVTPSAPISTAFPLGGISASPVSVSFYTSTAAIVYYTTDGSDPTYPPSGTTQIYSGSAITISSTRTLKWRARDSAGNLEAVKSSLYKVGDTTAPSVTSFLISSTSSSLTVPITALTATDDAGVTGYLITESSTPPSAGAVGWSGTAPESYTFLGSGTRTAYAWAKDAAGNVSAARVASVIITLQVNQPPAFISQPSLQSSNSSGGVLIYGTGDSEGDHYRLDVSTDNGVTWSMAAANEAPGLGQTLTLGGLTEGTYTVRLRLTALTGDTTTVTSNAVQLIVAPLPTGNSGLARILGNQQWNDYTMKIKMGDQWLAIGKVMVRDESGMWL